MKSVGSKKKNFEYSHERCDDCGARTVGIAKNGLEIDCWFCTSCGWTLCTECNEVSEKCTPKTCVGESDKDVSGSVEPFLY